MSWFEQEHTLQEGLHGVALEARKARHVYEELLFLRSEDRAALRDWRSEIVDTASLIVKTDESVWNVLRALNTPLTPEVLLRFFPSYARFHPLSENSLLYSTNGIASRPSKQIIAYIGASSSGKDTLLDIIIDWYRDHIRKIVTDTTRKRRIHLGEPRNAYNFENIEFLDGLVAQNKIVEGIRQGKDTYATETVEVIRALRGDQRAIFWRGDVIGYPKMRDFYERLHIPLVCVAVLPGLTDDEMVGRIKAKRGDDPEQQWRIQKAHMEIEQFADVADYIVINPPGDPVRGAKALGYLALRLIGFNESTTFEDWEHS